MDMLKKYFPLSFREKEVKTFVISLVIYVVIGIIAGVVCKLLSIIPFLGPILAWIIGSVVEIYTLAGIVLAILNFVGVFDKKN